MSEPVSPAMDAVKPEAEAAPEPPKEKPSPKISAAPREVQKAVPLAMIEVQTEYGTRLWVQKAAVIAVREGITPRFSGDHGLSQPLPRSTLVTLAGEWQVIQEAEEIVKALL